MHGFLRFTKDLDILIDLSPENASRAMSVLTVCGLKPRVPVDLAEFADPHKRNDRFENRNMLVFQFWHPLDAFCTVDMFIRNPIDFEELWQRAEKGCPALTNCQACNEPCTEMRVACCGSDRRGMSEAWRGASTSSAARRRSDDDGLATPRSRALPCQCTSAGDSRLMD